MSVIIENVNDILKRDGSLSNSFGDLSKIYLMTTENIRGFLEQFDLHNKEVLTVAGSGDQMLNSYLIGAKNVTCFDINPLAFYQVKLKKAAVHSLSYQEYLNFFFMEFGKILDRDLFEKVASELDQETLDFFMYLYDNYNNEQIMDKIYYRFSPSLEKMKRMNTYLEEENYELLKYNLEDKEVSFIHSDITQLRNNLPKNFYDLILLSNISDSIIDIWPEDCLKNFKRLIHSLSKNLADNGIIQVGYIYDYYHNRQTHPFRNKNLRQNVFTTDEFYTTFVGSYNSYSESDAVVYYQKFKRKN